MSQGKIKKIMDKGFGFIEQANGQDLFFHKSSLSGVNFEELREGQEVTYEVGRGQKGPCAEHVQLVQN